MKILLVEDEIKISSIIEKYLLKEGYEVSKAFNGEEAINKFENEEIDLIILDRMLPKLSGDEVIEFIRERSNIPIIMVTAKVEEKDIIEGFKFGADDYVVKPFSPGELLERIKAVLRRTQTNATIKRNILSYDNGHFIINLDNYTIELNGQIIELTKNEFEIVKVLFEHPKKIFTREEIIAAAFGADYEAYDRAIDTHIKNIRQKIEDNPKKPKYIVTVYGVGYKVGDFN